MSWWQKTLGRLYEVTFFPILGTPTLEHHASGIPETKVRQALLDEVCRQAGTRTAAAYGNSSNDLWHEPMDDIWYARALIATDFDGGSAAKKMEGYVKWRREFPGPAVPNQAWIDYAIVIVPFEDKYGRPVAISRLRSYHKGLPIELMTNGYRSTADGVVSHFLHNRGSEVSESNPLEQWILCIDCEGVGMDNLSMEYIRMFVRESNERYMERIATIFMLNPPRIWSLMWRMLKPMLHPRTLRKIQLVQTRDVPTVMCDLMGERASDLLPPKYGGSAPSFPEPGCGRTLEEKVGTLLADAWLKMGMELGEAETEGQAKDTALQQKRNLNPAHPEKSRSCCFMPCLGFQNHRSRQLNEESPRYLGA